MNEPVVISGRAADSIQALIERTQRLQDTLQTYVEALGAQLDVPSGWRFDTQSMAFVSPTNPAVAAPGELAPLSGERTE